MTPRPVTGADTLRWSRQLQRATGLDELLWTTLTFVRRHTRYRHAWLAVYDADVTSCRILSGIGAASLERLAENDMVTMPLDDDAMLREILVATEPVVVVDARTDPRPHPERVAAMNSRTIINVPIRFDGAHAGALGIGTFGEEGPMAPTSQELDHLSMIAAQLSVVIGRLRADERLLKVEAQLRAAQRLDAMGQLAGGVAHDFNNLLVVILGNVELARGFRGDSAQQAACLDGIEGATERAASLCRQLLSFSRREVHEVRPVGLADVVRDFVPMLDRVLPATVALELQGLEHGPVVQADPAQLEQVLMNLVINARDAMPAGGTITLAVSEADIADTPLQEGFHGVARAAQLVVRDTGVGIPEGLRNRIFEPFFTTKGPDQGTGLGLSVVHGIVEQHGGSVHAEASSAGGTSLRVFLPVADRAASTPRPQPTDHPSPSPRRILLVDDDASVRRVMRELLTRAGHQVVAAADGQEALLHLVSGGRFDLVVTDLVMPHMGGQMLLDELHRHDPELPVLVVSGYAGDTLGDQLPASPFLSSLSKPFSSAELLRAVAKLLDRASQASRAASDPRRA